MAKVILDAGHGGSDTGDIYKNHNERKDNLKLTLRIGQILAEKNIDVDYTRKEDTYLSRQERVKTANQQEGDLFVSIHRLFGSALRIGPDLNFYVADEDGHGYEAAENIGHSLMDIGFQKYGIRKSDLPILKDVNMPSMLAEIGYLKKDKENRFMDGYFEEIAGAVADGIAKTLKGERFIMAVSECRSCKGSSKAKEFKMGDYHFRVQVGTFRNYNDAFDFQIQLFDHGYPADIVRRGRLYSVLAGDYADMDEAVITEAALRSWGYDTVLVAIGINEG